MSTTQKFDITSLIKQRSLKSNKNKQKTKNQPGEYIPEKRIRSKTRKKRTSGKSKKEKIKLKHINSNKKELETKTYIKKMKKIKKNEIPLKNINNNNNNHDDYNQDYEKIPDIQNFNNNEFLRDLEIDAVRENRKIGGKNFIIIHKKNQHSNTTSTIDEIIDLYDRFLTEWLIPRKQKCPNCFQSATEFINKFGTLTKKQKNNED